MQNDKTYSEIVNSLVKTKYDANLFLTEIDVLQRSLYKVGEEDFDHALEKSVRAKTSYAIQKASMGASKEEVLKFLKNKINSLVFLKLTIAFEPTAEVIGRIHTWARQNVGEGVAIDFSVDKSILGGATIEYKGKFKSNTLAEKAEQYFLNSNVNL